MRSLIVYKENDNEIYNVDLDDQTAIGINVNVFNPVKPDVASVNISNEFTVPKTRNNVNIFDGIFNPNHNTNEYAGSDYNYKCDYFVDNHRLISGVIYLKSCDADRITMFIYDKYSVVSRLKQTTFGDFERLYLNTKYYDYSDWPINAPGYGNLGAMAGCYPNNINPRPLSSLEEDIWKETALSYYKDITIVSDWQSIKQALKKTLTKYKYFTYNNLCQLWNATINKLTMDVCNYYSPTQSNGDSKSYYTVGKLMDYWDANHSSDYDILHLFWNEMFFVFGISPTDLNQLPINMYLPSDGLGNRTEFLRVTSYVIEQRGTGETNRRYTFVPNLEFRPVEKISKTSIQVVKGRIASIKNLLLKYMNISNLGGMQFVHLNFATKYGISSHITDSQTIFDFLIALIQKIEGYVNDPKFDTYYGGAYSYSYIENLVDSITQDNINTVASELLTIFNSIKQSPGQERYATTVYDNVSVYRNIDDSLIGTTYDSSQYIANEDIITGAPSINITQAKNLTELEAWATGYEFFGECTDIITSGGLRTRRLTYDAYNELMQYARLATITVDSPMEQPFRFIPTSSSSEDSFTTDISTGLTSKIELKTQKVGDGDAKYNSGNLYVSSYNILKLISENFSVAIDIDEEFRKYFTNFSDLAIHTSSSNWWWDYVEDEKKINKTPRAKSMFDWLMMFCKIHSYIPVIDNSYYAEINGVEYTSKLYLLPYNESILQKKDGSMFNLRQKDSLKWLGCGDFTSQVYYVDYSSSEEGQSIHINEKSPLIINNESLSEDAQVLYNNGAHRMLDASFNGEDQYGNSRTLDIFKTSGSDNFQYIIINQVTTSSDLVESGISLTLDNGYAKYDIEGDGEGSGIVYSSLYIPEQKSIQQTNLPVVFLKNLIENPYPIIYEVSAYVDFETLYDMFFKNFDTTSVYYFPDLNGYYYITSIKGINGYNKKSSVTLTLYKYKDDLYKNNTIE